MHLKTDAGCQLGPFIPLYLSLPMWAGLTFHTARNLGFKGKCPERARQSRIFLMAQPQKPHCTTPIIPHWPGLSQALSGFKERVPRSPLLWVGVLAISHKEHVRWDKYIGAAIWGKYLMSQWAIHYNLGKEFKSQHSFGAQCYSFFTSVSLLFQNK